MKTAGFFIDTYVSPSDSFSGVCFKPPSAICYTMYSHLHWEWDGGNSLLVRFQFLSLTVFLSPFVKRCGVIWMIISDELT